MRLYKDKALTDEIIDSTLHFGIVETGGNGEVEVYVLNDSKSRLEEIIFTAVHPEVKLLVSPKILEAGEVKKLIYKWAPILGLEDEGLRTPIRIRYAKIAG